MSMLVCTVMLTTVMSGALAVEVHELLPPPPVAYSGPVPYGKKPPTSSTGSVNLAKKDYSYAVSSVIARVYTDKWLYGVDQIEVSVEGFQRVDDWNDRRSYDGVTVTVWNEKGKSVDSAFVDCSKRPYGGTCTLDVPDGDSFVSFAPVKDESTFSFHGTISGV